MNTGPEPFELVIVGNGSFPSHQLPLKLVRDAKFLYCCDGAADKLVTNTNLIPTAIIGDMDSISEDLRKRFADRLHCIPDQDTNDLHKAVDFALKQGHRKFALVGIFGEREDHALANFSLLWRISRSSEVHAFTDHGLFRVIEHEVVLESYPGQQISVFSWNQDVKIHCPELKWPLEDHSFSELWHGTLNQSKSEFLRFRIEGGPAMVFQAYGTHDK